MFFCGIKVTQESNENMEEGIFVLKEGLTLIRPLYPLSLCACAKVLQSLSTQKRNSKAKVHLHELNVWSSKLINFPLREYHTRTLLVSYRMDHPNISHNNPTLIDTYCA